MGKQYLMALDVGGGSGRCLLLDVETGAVSTTKRDWVHPPAPNTNGLGYDLDTADIWRKLGEASREVIEKVGAKPGEILGVAATSMRNTTVALDAGNNVIFGTPNLDARGLGEGLVLGAEQGRAIHETGGHWPSPLFTGSRLLWMKQNAPDLLEKISRLLLLSDWIGFRLGGGIFAERSQAGETLLFDLRKREWAFDLIESLGFDRGLFPETIDAGTIIGKLSEEAASHLGLQAGTPIAAAGADTQCGLLGSGAVHNGDLVAIAGTTLSIQLTTGELVLDDEGRLWSGAHVVPGLYVLESNGLTSGYVLEWFSGILYYEYENPIQALFSEAARSVPGGLGVYSTLGVDIFDARSLGIPTGNLTMSHMVTPGSEAGRRHISRALIEGIAYSTRANIEQITAVTGSEPRRIMASAGMSKSLLWTQIVSNVFGKEVEVPYTPEVSSLGAAICAGVGAQVFPDLVTGAERITRNAREHVPGEHSEKYQSLYAGWKEVLDKRAEADSHASNLMTMVLLEASASAPKAAEPSFKPRILVTAEVDEVALDELREIGEVEHNPWREAKKVYDGGKELLGVLGGYNVFITEMDVVDFEAIKGLPELKAIASCRGNPVNVDVESASAYGIPVVHTPGRNADAVADLVASFMIMLSRKLPGSAMFLKTAGVKEGDLEKMLDAYMTYEGHELWRKTVGIIGLGNVGSAVARRLKAFGAKVLFYDPYVDAEIGVMVNAQKVSFEELLSTSDFVSIHASKTEETRNMIDREAFSMMREGVFFINAARASIVDQDALREALESGRLAGAAIDVFPVEPPASDDRIVSRDNVITTPHLGGNTFEVAAHQGSIAVEQLKKLMRGETPEHILNPEVMEGFDWTRPRPEPSMSELERLANLDRPTILY